MQPLVVVSRGVAAAMEAMAAMAIAVNFMFAVGGFWFWCLSVERVLLVVARVVVEGDGC